MSETQSTTEYREPSAVFSVFDSPFAYRSLLFLIVVMYTAPMGYFPVLIPLHLAFVSAVLAITAYITAIRSQGRRLTIMGSEVKLILWLVVFAIISIPHSRWRGGSYDVLFDSYLKSVVVFFIIANVLTSEKRFNGFLWVLALCSAFNAVMGIKAFQGGSFTYGRISGGYSGLTSNPNDLALSLNLAIPFIGYLFLSNKSMLKKLALAAILIASVACVVVTYSRGGAITLLGILLWYLWRRSGRKRIGALIGASLLIGMIMLLAPAGYSDRLASTTDFSKDKSGSADARWTLMNEGVRQAFENPFGVGLGMMALLNIDEGLGWTGVHNTYLEIAIELGIIPVILFIVLLWKLIAGMGRIRSLPTALAGKLGLLGGATECSLVAFAVAAMFHAVAYNFYFYIIAGIAVAIMEIAGPTQDKQNETESPMASFEYLNQRSS